MHAVRYGSKSVGVALALSVVLLVGLAVRLRVSVPAHLAEPRLVHLTSCEDAVMSRARIELEAAHRYRDYLVDSRLQTPVKDWPRLEERIELVDTNIRVVRMQLAACVDAQPRVL